MLVLCRFQMVTENQEHKALSVMEDRNQQKNCNLIYAVYFLSMIADLMAMYACRVITSYHSSALAVCTLIGDNFMNPLKCCSLLAFSMSCPKLLSFSPWEEPRRILNLYLLTLREGILAEKEPATLLNPPSLLRTVLQALPATDLC